MVKNNSQKRYFEIFQQPNLLVLKDVNSDVNSRAKFGIAPHLAVNTLFGTSFLSLHPRNIPGCLQDRSIASASSRDFNAQSTKENNSMHTRRLFHQIKR